MMMVLLVPAGALAQAGVTLKGGVSETIALSVHPNSTHGDVITTGNTVRITIPDDHPKTPVMHVPLILRSNSSFKISAAVESETVLLPELSITNVRATGPLVSPRAITELNVPRQLDLRGLDENVALDTSPLDLSRPFVVVKGPRVSLGGTLNSPTNALEITFRIRLNPQDARGRLVHLTFVATADQ